jgi:hypothetical protein
MAKEVVITSVPRGIKLGRTGFQVVMRTAGTGDGVLSSLEQLGGYRHVHPQGSGRNPLIYSYRVVRGNTGQLNVLGRTVDAGNDFSNRSNKLAHLLAIDLGELSALRNSSPAAVLAAIDGKLATAWQGGPEERPSPLALPAPPIQPATCRRWNDVKGDAGWGGLLAQRAMRGQASLVIAPDCSPTWSRRLLDLFQEVLALLPPDGRWKTTFETTVIGSSSSMLRGTYAGSPESATGHAGLLVVDLTQTAPLPANVVADDLIKIAREGPKQAVAGKAPPIPGGRGAVPLFAAGTETSPMPTIGVHPAGPSGPSRAPVAWDADDERASPSRLGWYIGGGMLLLGVILVSVLVGGWYWFDDFTTKKLRQKIAHYADIEDGKDAAGNTSPTPDEWSRAYREDDADMRPAGAVFALLLSALRTKTVDNGSVNNADARRSLVRAVQAIADQKEPETLLDRAAEVGLSVPDDLDAKQKKDAGVFLGGWLASDRIAGGNAAVLHDFDRLQDRINLAVDFISALDDPERKTKLATVTPKILPNFFNKKPPEPWIDAFAKALDPAKTLDFKTVSKELAQATKPSSTSNDAGDRTAAKHADDQAKKEQLAFNDLCEKLREYQRQPPNKCNELDLATGLDVANLRFRIEMPSYGKWKPEALPTPENNPTHWNLKGLPDGSPERWGTLTVDKNRNAIVFKRDSSPRLEECHDPLYVPLRFSAEGSSGRPQTIVIAATEKTTFQSAPDQSLFSLMESGTLMVRANNAVVISPALANNGVTKLITHTIPGLLLAPRKTDVAGIGVDVVAQRPKEFETPISDIWLDSFHGTLARDEKGSLALLVVRDDQRPWTTRGSRLGELASGPLPPRQCNREKWEEIVKAILDASPQEELHGPKAKKAGPIVEQWLGGKPDDSDEKKTFDTEVNTLSLKGVAAWHDKASAYLFKDSSNYSVFTSAKAKQEMGFDRPRNDPEPPGPPKGAPPEDVAALNQKREAWKENDRKLKLWIAEFERLRYSSQNVVAFLKLAPNERLPDPSNACRAAAVVVLELAAKQVAEKAKTAMETAPLGSLFSVSLALPWVFEDGTKESVDRLTIQPAPVEKPAKVPTASLQQPAINDPPTATTPSKPQ